MDIQKLIIEKDKIIIMDYQGYKAEAKRLTDIVDKLSENLNGFPREANGLTIESIRMSPEYRGSKRKYDAAFKIMADHNRKMVRIYKKEVREDAMRKRLEKRSK